MFSTLETTWDRPARRGWSTLASFGFQAMAVSLLLLIPMLTIQGPPKLQWFGSLPVLAPPPAPAPPVGEQRRIQSSNIREGPLQQPTTIPATIASLNEPQVGSAPDLSEIGVVGGTGSRGRGIIGAMGPSVEVAPPPPAPGPTHPIKVSHWAEGNLIYRVQPAYPEIARQVRVQGSVQLRAIISKAGTIENLVVESGHPMLVAAAIKAVRQWRYRPYRLNGEPVEVEAEVTVNFVLGGS
jgi:periplasmic protein TonB